jgi:hypothetical protein
VTLPIALFLSDEEDPKRFAAATPITDTPVVDEPPPQELGLAAKSSKASRKPIKKVVVVRSSSRVKKSSDAGASLEAHPQAPPTMYVKLLAYLLLFLRVDTHALFLSRI